jgi:hypothetical protein
MKKIILALAFVSFLTPALQAQQKESIKIQKGTVLQYIIYPPGLSVNYTFTVDSITANYRSFTWMSESGSVGQFIMTEASVHTATRGYWSPPEPWAVMMDKDQTVLCFSKTLFQQLKQNKQVEFDGVSYLLKEIPATEQIVLNSKPIDALFLESTQGSRIWLLNNEQFPAILKIKDNPLGVDVEITAIQ